MALTKDSFWQFSLSVYPKWQTELLQWQYKHKANVNLALLCLYLDQLDRQLATHQIRELHLQVQTFSRQFTQLVRQCRRTMKQSQTLLNEYEAIRQHLLDAELILERQEQGELLAKLNPDAIEAVNSTPATNWQRYQQLLQMGQV